MFVINNFSNLHTIYTFKENIFVHERFLDI